MLNSKLKRSMAWIMTAAVVMTAVPVSAADFSSEADIEVSAETAEVGESPLYLQIQEKTIQFCRYFHK